MWFRGLIEVLQETFRMCNETACESNHATDVFCVTFKVSMLSVFRLVIVCNFPWFFNIKYELDSQCVQLFVDFFCIFVCLCVFFFCSSIHLLYFARPLIVRCSLIEILDLERLGYLCKSTKNHKTLWLLLFNFLAFLSSPFDHISNTHETHSPQVLRMCEVVQFWHLRLHTAGILGISQRFLVNRQFRLSNIKYVYRFDKPLQSSFCCLFFCFFFSWFHFKRNSIKLRNFTSNTCCIQIFNHKIRDAH